MKRSSFLPAIIQEKATELPFFIFLSLVMLGLYALSVVTRPSLHTPLPLALFTCMMVAHICLYWIIPTRINQQRLVIALLVTQGLLAFAMSQLGANFGLIFGLYLGLIGITIGIYHLNKTAVVFIGYYLALSLINYLLVMGVNELKYWAIGILPSMTFVIIYVMLYTRQTEATNRAQALSTELETANHHLAEYAAKVEELTLTNERERMARELHDTLSQGLAGLILQLEAVDAHLTNQHTERAQTIVRQAMLQARATLADARGAIDNLRQIKPEKSDLAAAIRETADRFSEATSIVCQLETNLQETIPDTLCEPVRRIVSEALTNIIRHARASQVNIHLTSEKGELRLSVQDNGSGFSLQGGNQQNGHYGLLGMQERARLAGGKLEVTSAPGAGTQITVRLPLCASSSSPVAEAP